MRKALAFSFFALGLTSLVAQVLLIRELLIVFTGNEFFIGWTLAGWLLWTALGAGLAGRLGGGAERAPRRLVGCHVGAALLLPAALAFIRAGRTLLGSVPGAVPDLVPSLGFSLVALAPLCLVLGAQFVWGVRAWKPGEGGAEPGTVQGRAYALETAGFVAGGLLFTYLFVFRDEFRTAGWIGGLNVLAGFALCAGFRVRSLRLVLLLALAAMVPAAIQGGRIGRRTGAWRYPGQVLVDSRHSIYGHLDVAAVDRQLAFYENGLLLGAENEPLASELLVHFPMLAHPNPKRVLLIGAGFNGALDEILKHGPERVDYVELDPLWISLAKTYAAPARRAALADPRVRTIFADGRFFLRRRARAADDPAAGYDVVLVNLPNPGTALINRYYSREFFRDVRLHLAPGGVLAVRLAFSPDYLGPELENLGASIDRTLRAEFASVALLPDCELFYLATAEETPPPVAADWIARYEARGLKTDFVIPPAIALRLGTDRIGRVRAAFDANRTAQINRDARPIACYYDFVYWLRSFHPRAAAAAGRLGEMRWPWGAAAAALAAAGMAGAGRGKNARRIGAWAMGVGSFTLMAAELTLLLAFQAFCGYLYYRLALILAALMLGMAAGTVWGTRRIAHARFRTLAGVHALLAAHAAVFALFLRWMEAAAPGPSAWMEGAFLLLAAAVGGLVGYEFPAANRIYLAGAAETGRNTGAIYGADLAGSCLAALGIGLWALPVLGSETTLAILAALNGIVAAGIAKMRRAD